jgi:RNA polymerase sigma factor (sigma-70 family)
VIDLIVLTVAADPGRPQPPKETAVPATQESPRRLPATVSGIRSYVRHESLAARNAARLYDPREVLDAAESWAQSHMPDDVTRDCARRMHYAAYRHERARTRNEAEDWKQKYYALRDLIVLGNQKLVYRAVRKQMSFAYRADDMIGEGHIVLIRAVAAYNPWLGIRFSTYAFTCLMRAFFRLARQYSADWLARTVALDGLTGDDGPSQLREHESDPVHDRLGEFLGKDHPLLSEREKYILNCRYRLADESPSRTLAEVGQDLGLSKERVRQVQTAAMEKLRLALVGTMKGATGLAGE